MTRSMPWRQRTGLRVLPALSRDRPIGRKSGRAQRHNGQTVSGGHSNGLTAPHIDRLPDTTIPIDHSGRRFSPTRFWLTGATTSSVHTIRARATRRQAKNALSSGWLLFMHLHYQEIELSALMRSVTPEAAPHLSEVLECLAVAIRRIGYTPPGPGRPLIADECVRWLQKMLAVTSAATCCSSRSGANMSDRD
jgi:hypothetical protein